MLLSVVMMLNGGECVGEVFWMVYVFGVLKSSSAADVKALVLGLLGVKNVCVFV